MPIQADSRGFPILQGNSALSDAELWAELRRTTLDGAEAFHAMRIVLANFYRELGDRATVGDFLSESQQDANGNTFDAAAAALWLEAVHALKSGFRAP